MNLQQFFQSLLLPLALNIPLQPFQFALPVQHNPGFAHSTSVLLPPMLSTQIYPYFPLQFFLLPLFQNIPTQSSQLPIPAVHHVPEFSTLVLPTNLSLMTSANLYSFFSLQSLSMPSVQNIPAAQYIPELPHSTPVPSTNLLPTTSVKSYLYFPNGYSSGILLRLNLSKESGHLFIGLMK